MIICTIYVYIKQMSDDTLTAMTLIFILFFMRVSTKHHNNRRPLHATKSGVSLARMEKKQTRSMWQKFKSRISLEGVLYHSMMHRESSGKLEYDYYSGDNRAPCDIDYSSVYDSPGTVGSAEGSNNEDTTEVVADDPKFPDFTSNRKLVMKMLERENYLRCSNETQRLYDDSTTLPSITPTSIDDDIQRRVLVEHHIADSADNLHLYRSLNGLYQDDTEVRDLAAYMKYNYSLKGDLTVGDSWPDMTLLTFDKRQVRMSDYVRDLDKPFLIFTGSRSTPPFQVSVLNGILRRNFLMYKNKANFLFVYVLEAHAKDQWPLGIERSSLNQHKTIEDRIDAARKLLLEDTHSTFTESVDDVTHIPAVVDPMDNAFNAVYAAWPERLYIIFKKRIYYISMPDDGLLTDVVQDFFDDKL